MTNPCRRENGWNEFIRHPLRVVAMVRRVSPNHSFFERPWATAGMTSINDYREQAAVLHALEAGKLRAPVYDFPGGAVLHRKRRIASPAIGACTEAADKNGAVMVVDQIRDGLKDDTIHNAVNLPDVVMPRMECFWPGIANILFFRCQMRQGFLLLDFRFRL
jgi:hypothetical protein